MASGDITPLARPVATRLRSALVIPTIPQILNELVQNSLDAGCTRVECFIDLTRENETIRVEDDGHGLDQSGLARIGEQHVSSKTRAESSHTPISGYGFRGEALSAIAALAMLEITSKTAGSRHAYTTVIRSSSTLVQGKSNRPILGDHGTTVTVKDLYHKIPVRQASLANTSPATIMAGCRKVIESLAIVHPAVQWTLWEESVGVPPRKVIGVRSTISFLEAYRQVFGNALVDRVQKIRVSSGHKRVDGFISLRGHISRTHQYLYINKFPMDRGELHTAIAKRFAASHFSFMTQDDAESSGGRRQSPRRAERHPIYALNLSLPPEDVDLMYHPNKRSMGTSDPGSVVVFVLAVVDEYLKRNGFAKPATTQQLVPGRIGPKTDAQPTKEAKRASGSMTPLSTHFGQAANRAMAPPKVIPQKRHLADQAETPPNLPVAKLASTETASANRRRGSWLRDLVAETDTGVMPFSTPGISPSITPFHDHQSSAPRHCCSQFTRDESTRITDIQFTSDSLETAQIIGQVDRKYIACVLATKLAPHDRSLVLIDQHAADERVGVEAILSELCIGFHTDSIKRTKLQDTFILLTRHQALQLANLDILQLLARWGIVLDPPAPAFSDYIQVAVKAVPSLLAYRLARKETSEITRLVRQHLTSIPSESEIRASLESSTSEDWQVLLRWMPKEMLDLVNSKACRNAIMFEDALDKDQCERLVRRLAQTKSPWICAHGRPSLAPLGLLSASPPLQRSIDWASWPGDYEF